MATAPPPSRLADALGGLATRYDRAWLASDPLAWPRRFTNPADREVVAVVAALLAYGRVAQIQASVAAVLGAIGEHPARALDRVAPGTLRRRLCGFRHRWTTGSDVAWLLGVVAAIRVTHGSLGRFVLGHARGEAPLRSALAAWRDRAHAGRPTRDARRRRARAFLLPDVRAGGACKRLLLLARWCVRPDDGIDLGLWRGAALTPADLLVPLDVHVHRVALDLGLTGRARPDWRAAEEVTAALKTVDPADPVRFDFALARPGIAGACRHRYVAAVCEGCALAGLCRHARARVPPTSRTRTPARSPRTRPWPGQCP